MPKIEPTITLGNLLSMASILFAGLGFALHYSDRLSTAEATLNDKGQQLARQEARLDLVEAAVAQQRAGLERIDERTLYTYQAVQELRLEIRRALGEAPAP